MRDSTGRTSIEIGSRTLAYIPQFVNTLDNANFRQTDKPGYGSIQGMVSLLQIGYPRGWSGSHFKVYPRLPEQIQGGIIGILAKADEPGYFCIDQHLGTEDARRMRTIDCASLKANPVEGRLDDRILLGMDASAYFVPGSVRYAHLVSETTKLKAVFEARGGAIVAGGKDVLILHCRCPHMVPATGRAFSYDGSYLQEILVNGWPTYLLHAGWRLSFLFPGADPVDRIRSRP